MRKLVMMGLLLFSAIGAVAQSKPGLVYDLPSEVCPVHAHIDWDKMALCCSDDNQFKPTVTVVCAPDKQEQTEDTHKLTEEEYQGLLTIMMLEQDMLENLNDRLTLLEPTEPKESLNEGTFKYAAAKSK